ncbi:bola-like protein [Dunaliella salina]|uniref:Bola-like protein n=1 Tax=Dunaliella salina TaxID=3046 RepID=A0ABQ7H589_DUNSA|nr:bola-like protein [Dunaliella salina]|eukprot:KAF5842025.1 bola-like protein [Dunaliella salina]
MAAILSSPKFSLFRSPAALHTKHTVAPAIAPVPSSSLSSHEGRIPSTSYGTKFVARSIPVSGPQPSSSGEPQPSVMNAAPPGQIAAELVAAMQTKIKADLETEHVRIADAYGDGRHVSIEVVSPLFEGQNAVKRQRMVYKAIWLELQEAVHAVDSMTTKTPAEVGMQ